MITLASSRAVLAVRVVFAVGLAAASFLLTVPASAQGQSLPSAEAWYLYLPTDGGDDGGGGGGGGGGGELPPEVCESGLPSLPGCPESGGGEDPTGGEVSPRVSPYPENTLHVSLNAGADDTITMLELEDQLAPPGDIDGGTITLPVAGADAGTAGADTAEFQACAISGSVEDGVEAGDPATAPSVDCTAAAPAVFQPGAEGQDGTFTIDVTDLASRWQFSTPAVALVPTEAAKEAGASWHVAFSARDREAEGATPISFSFTYAEEEQDDPSSIEPPPSTSSGPSSSGGGSSSVGSRPPSGGSTSGSTTPVRPAPAPPRTPTPGSAGAPAISPVGVDATGNPLGTAIDDSEQSGTVPLGSAALAPGAAAPVVAAPVATGPPGVGLVYPQAYFLPLIALIVGSLVSTSLVRPMRVSVDEVAPRPVG